MNRNTEDNVRQMLMGLSPRDFLNIGMNEIGYVRAVKTAERASPSFAVHAADGTQLSVLDSMDRAIAAIHNNDLLMVTLH